MQTVPAAAAESLQSCPTRATPTDVQPAPQSLGFQQATLGVGLPLPSPETITVNSRWEKVLIPRYSADNHPHSNLFSTCMDPSARLLFSAPWASSGRVPEARRKESEVRVCSLGTLPQLEAGWESLCSWYNPLRLLTRAAGPGVGTLHCQLCVSTAPRGLFTHLANKPWINNPPGIISNVPLFPVTTLTSTPAMLNFFFFPRKI